MDLTPKQQTSEAIRQAETILILTGQHPSVDQVTAVVALSAILRKFGKTVTAVVSDNPPAAVQVLDGVNLERNMGGQRDFVLKLDVSKVELDKLRYEVEEGKLNIYLTPFKGSFAPSDVTFGYGESNINYDLTIVLGVPTRARIDRLFGQNESSFENIPLVNLDFHRSNENYGAVNLIEPNASSLCEMLVALSESLQSGIIDGEIATALLMGIMASTDRFTASHTSPKSLTVAAQMMAAGARQQLVVKALYREGKGGDNRSNERQGSERRDNRPNERREDRPERRDERSNDNPRPSAQNQPARVEQRPTSQPEPAAPAQPEPVQAAPVTQPLSPTVAVASASSFDQPEPEAAPEVAPNQVQAFDEPIIEPSHIEMSQPEPTADQNDPIPAVDAPGAATPTQPERPVVPMADFAAAAEMFSQQTVPEPTVSEQDQS